MNRTGRITIFFRECSSCPSVLLNYYQLLMNELDDEKVKNPEGGQAAVNDARSDRMEEEDLIRQEIDQGSIKNNGTNIEPRNSVRVHANSSSEAYQ